MNKGQIEFRTYRTFARVLSELPEPVAFRLAAAAGDVLYRVRKDQRAVVIRNLRRVLDADGADAVALDRWARHSFRAYARYWVEGARLASMSPQEIEQRTMVSGFDRLVDAMAAGRGAILALPHVGSWEFGGAYLATQGIQMTAVAERIEPPELFEFFLSQRASMGLRIVPLGSGSGRAVLSTLREGGLVGLLCERDIEGNGIDVEFFGEKTTMPAGPATLALRTGAALLTAAVYSGPGRDHHGVVDPPVDLTRRGSLRADVARITQEVASRLERLIARAPDQWHVFQPLWSVDRIEEAQ